MVWINFLVLFFISNYQNQSEYRVEYLRVDNKAEEKVNKLPVANKMSVLDMIKETTYTLYAGKKATLYTRSKAYAVYHDMQKGIWLKKASLGMDPVLVKYDSVPMHWKILGETKQIGKYHAIKAVTLYKGAQVIAWFTPEINISSGPDFFHGLPGLILAVEWKEYTYTAVKIVKDTRPIQKPEAPEVLSEKEYQRALKQLGGFSNNGLRVIILNK